MEENSMFLSIVIPVYNAAKFLEECLDFCLDQELEKNLYEIICIDDGSSDNSAAILSCYQKKYDHIIVFHQENRGVSAARNRGINESRGKYVWFIDADDFPNRGFVSELYKQYKDKDYDMILFGAYHMGMSFTEEEKTNFINGSLSPNHPLQSVYITRRLIKRSFLISHNIVFNEKISHGEDALFDYLINNYNPKIALNPSLGYFYRIHPGSVMRDKSDANKIKYIDSHITAIATVKTFFDKERGCKFRSIRYILEDLQSIFNVIATLRFDDAKEQIKKLQCKKTILPYKKHHSFRLKDIVITVYTNLTCISYDILIRISASRAGFAVLKAETKWMNSRIIKDLLHRLKKRFSYLSKD